MECFGTTDFDNNNRMITLSTIIISGLHCICICLLYKSPEYHLRIPVLGKCTKHHFTHDAHACSCQSFRFSYKKTLAHDRPQNAVFRAIMSLPNGNTKVSQIYGYAILFPCTNSNLHYTHYWVNYSIYSNTWWGIFSLNMAHKCVQSS
jgi:hypothetical protein